MDILDHTTSFESATLGFLARDAVPTGDWDLSAMTATVMAFTALEAFVNEVGQLAATELVRAARHHEAEPPKLRELEFALRIARENRASTCYQYDIAREVLDGSPPDPGQGARQDLGTLTKLRNALVHMQSTQVDIYIEPPTSEDDFIQTISSRHPQPRFMTALAERQLLSGADDTTSWTNNICTGRLANWACDTVEQVAHELVASTPEETNFREQLESHSLGGTITRKRNPSRFGLG